MAQIQLPELPRRTKLRMVRLPSGGVIVTMKPTVKQIFPRGLLVMGVLASLVASGIWIKIFIEGDAPGLRLALLGGVALGPALMSVCGAVVLASRFPNWFRWIWSNSRLCIEADRIVVEIEQLELGREGVTPSKKESVTLINDPWVRWAEHVVDRRPIEVLEFYDRRHSVVFCDYLTIEDGNWLAEVCELILQPLTESPPTKSLVERRQPVSTSPAEPFDSQAIVAGSRIVVLTDSANRLMFTFLRSRADVITQRIIGVAIVAISLIFVMLFFEPLHAMKNFTGLYFVFGGAAVATLVGVVVGWGSTKFELTETVFWYGYTLGSLGWRKQIAVDSIQAITCRALADVDKAFRIRLGKAVPDVEELKGCVIRHEKGLLDCDPSLSGNETLRTLLHERWRSWGINISEG